MKRLTKEQVLRLHSELICETGGTDGLRDEGLLDSALNTPFQSYDGVEIFPSLQQKGARLGYGLVPITLLSTATSESARMLCWSF